VSVAALISESVSAKALSGLSVFGLFAMSGREPVVVRLMSKALFCEVVFDGWPVPMLCSYG
jgi:hypothetical protein